MSVLRYQTYCITCDIPDCRTPPFLTDEPTSPYEIGRAALRAGWSREGAGHMCPTCRRVRAANVVVGKAQALVKAAMVEQEFQPDARD